MRKSPKVTLRENFTLHFHEKTGSAEKVEIQVVIEKVEIQVVFTSRKKSASSYIQANIPWLKKEVKQPGKTAVA